MKIFHLNRVLEFRLARSVRHRSPPFVGQSYENNATDDVSMPPGPNELASWLKDDNRGDLSIFFCSEKDICDFLSVFFENFHLIDAAGGLVLNPAGELLMIHRRGVWDLPKGKVDAGEHLEATARREVREETGLRRMRVEARWYASHHIYPGRDGAWVLKPTYWFLMRAPRKAALHPQAGEGIERAEWVPPEAWPERVANSYASLAELMTTLDKCRR